MGLIFSFMVSSLIAAFHIRTAAEKPMTRSSDCHPLCCGRGAAEGIQEACKMKDPPLPPFLDKEASEMLWKISTKMSRLNDDA